MSDLLEVKKAVDELQRTVVQFKQDNDKEIKEIKAKGHADPLLAEKVGKTNDAIDAVMARLEKAEAALNRKEMPQEDVDKHKQGHKSSAEHKSGLNKYLRKGERHLTEVEAKAMSVDSDPDGGYTVTPEMASEIVQKVFESSPIRQRASVLTISSDRLEMMEDLDEVDDGWVSETQDRDSESDNPELGMLIFPAHEQHSEPRATQKILDDSAFNVESWLSGKVSQKFIRSEATAFVLGNGVLRPRGFMTFAHGTSGQTIEQVNSGHATQFTADGLIDIVYSLKEAYLANANWEINRLGVKAIRKLKDSQNQYLWSVGLNGKASQDLLGYPIDMASDIAVPAANALAAAFGDFRSGYQIVDRAGIRVLRDNLTKKGFVKFYTTRRIGGGVKNFEAIKIQKLAV